MPTTATTGRIESRRVNTRRIHILCIQQGKRLKDFAADVGYAPGWISKIINNKEPRYNSEILADLANWLGVEEDTLYIEQPLY